MPKPVAIREVVNKVIQGLNSSGSGETDKQDIIRALNRLLDKKTLRHVKIERYENSRLIIRTDSSVWLYVLNMQKAGLLKGLKQELHNTEINKLLFKIGRI
jgi:hypothetical protein